MKKYLSIIALCVTNLTYADGFENLKALQNQFHLLIYNAENLGAAAPAPEVPYIAGILGVSQQPILDQESGYIYYMLRTALNANAKIISSSGLNPEKVAAFDDISFNAFRAYDPYKDSGHSVFGIAAQELPIRLPRVVVNRPAIPTPVPTKVAGGGGMAEQLAAGKKLKSAAVTNVSPPPAAAPKSLLERVQEYIGGLNAKSKLLKNEEADLRILQELEEKAKISEARTGDEKIRYDELIEFFGHLENPPAAPATKAKVGQLRMKLKPKDAVVALSPVQPASNTNITSSTTGSSVLHMLANSSKFASLSQEKNDEENDEEDDEINLDAINVASLDAAALKKKLNELQKLYEDAEDNFKTGYAERINIKIEEIKAQMKSMGLLQQQPPISALLPEKTEAYLTDAELDETTLVLTNKAMYKEWRDERRKTPEQARKALNNFPPKYEGESYSPNPKKAVPTGAGGRRGSMVGGVAIAAPAGFNIEELPTTSDQVLPYLEGLASFWPAHIAQRGLSKEDKLAYLDLIEAKLESITETWINTQRVRDRDVPKKINGIRGSMKTQKGKIERM